MSRGSDIDVAFVVVDLLLQGLEAGFIIDTMHGQPAIFYSWQMARTVKAGPGHYYDQIHRAWPAADQYFGQHAGYMCYAR